MSERRHKLIVRGFKYGHVGSQRIIPERMDLTFLPSRFTRSLENEDVNVPKPVNSLVRVKGVDILHAFLLPMEYPHLLHNSTFRESCYGSCNIYGLFVILL